MGRSSTWFRCLKKDETKRGGFLGRSVACLGAVPLQPLDHARWWMDHGWMELDGWMDGWMDAWMVGLES